MRLSRTCKTRHSGFTLVELMLVMLILAILAAIIVVPLAGRRDQARQNAAKADIAQLDTALDMFEVDCGRYPANDEGVQALISMPGNIPLGNWKGPYLKKATPKDPWGNPYVYVAPGQHNKHYDLYTTHGGKDASGNEINNWDDGQIAAQ